MSIQFVRTRDLDILFPILGGGLKPFAETPAGRDSRFVAKRGRLRGYRALTDISIDLVRGNRLALIGSNGAGKTTLLQALSGILVPDRGSIEIRGKVTSLTNVNLGIQPSASGHRNIWLSALAAGEDPKDIVERTDWITDFSELGDFLHMPYSTYSAGMKMRLNFSIATAFQPEILLMDEWLGAGDQHFRQKATARMQRLVDRSGILVLASHNKQLLRDNCDRAIWLNRGSVHAAGSVDDVLSQFSEHEERKSHR